MLREKKLKRIYLAMTQAACADLTFETSRLRLRIIHPRRLFGKWIVNSKASQEPIGWVETFKYSYSERGNWLGDFAGIGYEFLPDFV